MTMLSNQITRQWGCNNIAMPKRARLSAEVSAAVDDIINGTSVDSSTDWLQREYIRLMRREFKMKKEMAESKSRVSMAPTDSHEHAKEDRSVEQHGGQVDGAGPHGHA